MVKRSTNVMQWSDTAAQTEEERARSIVRRFCVLVSSSDDRRDIFEIVFKNADRMWCHCDWPRYVGLTTKQPDIYGFRVLAAKHPSGWQGELLDQIDSLPEEIEYLYLTFEDALFMSPVDGTKLNAIAELIVAKNIPYVSLVPLSRNIPGRVIEHFRRKLSKHPLRRLSLSEPYYSSLVAAIWKRSYLRSLLGQPGSIWDFEHLVSGEPHYAVWEPVIDHDQIVTKGKWAFRAERLLANQGISLANSKRGFRSVKAGIRDIREKIVWELGGFTSFRIRRRLKMISHRGPADPAAAGTLGRADTNTV